MDDPRPWSGNVEGGYTDRQGRRWLHVPNKGWRLAAQPEPFLALRRAPKGRFRRVATRVLGREVL